MNPTKIAVPLISGTRLFVFFALLAMLTGLLTVTQPVRATTYEVTSWADSGAGSLREAITKAKNNHGPDTITFSAKTNGKPIILSGATGEDLNLSGDLDIMDVDDLTILGNGAANTIISGGENDRVFHICTGGSCANTVVLSGLTIGGGKTPDGSGGGGIYNLGTTTVSECAVISNSAGDGGGIRNEAMLNIEKGSIIGAARAANTAEYGGGIYNTFDGTITVSRSTISHNTADYGGAIYNTEGKTTLTGSTISDNEAGYGGAIFNWDTLEVLKGSIIGGTGAANEANFGGGIYNETGGTTTIDVI